VAAVGSVAMSAIVYFGVGLKGSFLVFWITYFATLCVGIGEPGPSPPFFQRLSLGAERVDLYSFIAYQST
jgi:hypothetical protein